MRFCILLPFTGIILDNNLLVRFEVRRLKWLLPPFVRTTIPVPVTRKRFAVALCVLSLYFLFLLLLLLLTATMAPVVQIRSLKAADRFAILSCG